MTQAQATIVVDFGAGADTDAVAVVELEDTGKSSFAPGTEVVFLVHYDQSKLRVASVAASSGMVVPFGQAQVERRTQGVFPAPDAAVDLPHIPSGPVTATWYGKAAAIGQEGRRITARNGTPAIGELVYKVSCLRYKLIPPPLDLADDETWPVLVVVRMEAA